MTETRQEMLALLECHYDLRNDALPRRGIFQASLLDGDGWVTTFTPAIIISVAHDGMVKWAMVTDGLQQSDWHLIHILGPVQDVHAIMCKLTDEKGEPIEYTSFASAMTAIEQAKI
jgi:hypothetical protein